MQSSRFCLICRTLGSIKFERNLPQLLANCWDRKIIDAKIPFANFTTNPTNKPRLDKALGNSRKDHKENIFTIPNALCLSRIALSPVLGYFVVNGQYEWSMAIFAYAAITDVLDGWIARTFDQQSIFGSLLDPVADKILVSALVLSLTYVGLIPVPLTVLILARDIILIVAGCVLRYVTLDPPKTLARYFNMAAPSVQMKPTAISKFNTFVQLGLVGLSLAAPVFGFVDHQALHALWYVTAGTTVASGLSYVFGSNTYSILRKGTKSHSS